MQTVAELRAIFLRGALAAEHKPVSLKAGKLIEAVGLEAANELALQELADIHPDRLVRVDAPALAAVLSEAISPHDHPDPDA
jgi:hypothetical protein